MRNENRMTNVEKALVKRRVMHPTGHPAISDSDFVIPSSLGISSFYTGRGIGKWRLPIQRPVLF